MAYQRKTDTYCPHCHQPYRAERVGVRMTVLKARIYDAIKAPGEVGASNREVAAAIGYTRHSSIVGKHVRQINDMLEGTEWRIVSDGRGPNARWHIRRGSAHESWSEMWAKPFIKKVDD